MHPGLTTRTAALLAAALAVASALGYWGVSPYRKSELQEALRAKDRLEKDYSDYRLSAEALSRLLESYPDARKKLALHVGGALLADEGTAAAARRRALENSKRVASEVERARQLAAVR